MKGLRFVEMTESHVPEVLAIEVTTNRSQWSERSFLNELTNPVSYFVVGLIQNEVVAFGGIWKVVDEAHVTTVAVAENQRRKGIGRALMLELLGNAKKSGMTCATLEVRASNAAALQLYENLGFVSCARRKGYYPDNKEDAIVMWLYELHSWSAPA